MSISKMIAGLTTVIALIVVAPGQTTAQTSSTGKAEVGEVIGDVAGEEKQDWFPGYPEFGNYTNIEGAVELKDYRSENSRTYYHINGTTTSHTSSAPVHYRENGEWLDINPGVTPNNTGVYPNHVYTNATNTFKSFYPEKLTANGLVSVFEGDNEVKEMIQPSMYYVANGQQLGVISVSNASAQVNANKVVYEAAYGAHVDIEFTQHPDLRKLDYVVNNRAAFDNMPQGATHLVFEETVELPNGWTATVEDNIIQLADASGDVQAWYSKPICHEKNPAAASRIEYELDKDEPVSARLYEAEYEISQQGNQVVIKTKVSTNWLLDANRQYPLVIDPSISASAPNNGYYQDNGGNNRQVTTSGAPGGSLITSVNFSVTTTVSYYGGSCNSWWAYRLNGINKGCGQNGNTNWNGTNPNRTWTVTAYDIDGYVDYVYYYFTVTANYAPGCTNGFNGNLATPTCSEQTLSVGSGERRDVSVVNGRSYRFRLTNCPSGWTMQITGRNTSNTQMFQRTSTCNVTQNWTATFSGTLRLNINRSNCQLYQGNNSAILRWRQNPPASGATTTWIGGTNSANNWNLDYNWNNCKPNINIHANIPNTGAQPRIGASSAAKTLTIANGRVVSVECNNCLQIGNP